MKVKSPAEKLLFSTVRLETESPDTNEIGSGTSFVFGYEKYDGLFLALVTNKHVIQGSRLGRFFFTKRTDNEPMIGDRFNVEMDQFEQRWFQDPNPKIDIAVMPLRPVLDEIDKAGGTVYFQYIPHNLIPSDEQIEELDVLEEVVFIGYPSGIYDRENLLPLMRQGTTASPLQVDYEGLPAFLIDASVFPGSSGSPVFIYNLGGYSGRRGFTVGSRLYFLGIIAEVAFREQEGSLEFQSIPTSLRPIIKTREMIDLGLVFKSKSIVSTVEGLLEKVEEARARASKSSKS